MVFPIEMMGNNGIFKTMKINTNVSFSLRNLEDKTSGQYLQILFSFSIPNEESLEKIQNLEKPIISAGAVSMMVNALCHVSHGSICVSNCSLSFSQGTGYWEFLLTNFYALDVVAFDSNTSYPESMHYTPIQVIVKPFCDSFF